MTRTKKMGIGIEKGNENDRNEKDSNEKDANKKDENKKVADYLPDM